MTELIARALAGLALVLSLGAAGCAGRGGEVPSPAPLVLPDPGQIFGDPAAESP